MSVSCASVAQVPFCTFRYGSRKSAIFVPYLGLSGWTLSFERLCQLVLRESGFIKVQVTGRSGDGGIDGIGILKMNLLSFHVSFQCKRYQGSVGSAELRDFRGAMIGRGDKGIFITTGSFSSEARKEANRDGAPAIDLIDGEDLCELLKNLRLGLTTESVEKVTVKTEWFDSV
jgi:restriction system protein